MEKISREQLIKTVIAIVVSVVVLGVTYGVEYTSANKKASYTAGTYTAEATGFGNVTMTATFSGTAITAIELDVSEETETIGGAAADELIAQCLEAQSSDIDGVSGATLTSQAVRDCLDDCISQANGN